MKIMKMKCKILITALTLIAVFTATQAYAYYNPSTGRWLSRDPNGELGFQTLRAAQAMPRIGNTAPLPPGRILTRDPIGKKGELNLYGFVQNNPVELVDPHGLDIYTMEGNDTWNPVNNEIHVGICVDTWGRGTNPVDRVCFSYHLSGVGIYGPRNTWLGWRSWTFCCLRGTIYVQDFKNGTILRRLKTTPNQDIEWLRYMMQQRLDKSDGYSVARHNCVKYSNMEFDDAPNHYGPP